MISAMAFTGPHDCLYLFQFFGLRGILHRDRTQVLFAMESSGVCDFPYLAVTVLLPVQHYLGREVRRLPAKHSNERAVLIHAAGVRQR